MVVLMGIFECKCTVSTCKIQIICYLSTITINFSQNIFPMKFVTTLFAIAVSILQFMSIIIQFGLPHKISNLKIPSTQNPEILKMSNTQNPTIKIPNTQNPEHSKSHKKKTKTRISQNLKRWRNLYFSKKLNSDFLFVKNHTL